MCPVFEERPVLLQQSVQHARLVAVEATGQDQVVRPFDDVDRIKLDVAQLPHECARDGGRGPPGRIVEQSLGAEEQPPGGGRGDGWDGSRGQEGNFTLSAQLL